MDDAMSERTRALNQNGRFRLWIGSLIVLGVIGAMTLPAHGQIQLREIPQSGQVIEPIDGQFQSVFEFEIEDVDPLANDLSSPRISCFVVQNLGTLKHEDIQSIRVSSSNEGVFAEGTTSPGGGSHPDCPDGSSGAAFEKFIPFGGVDVTQTQPFEIPDDGQRRYQVALKLKSTTTLGDRAEGRNARISVKVQLDEEVGSPPQPETFTATVDDTSQATFVNAGINSSRSLDIEPDTLQILPGGSSPFGRVAAFEVCDEDSNAVPLELDTIRIQQGPSGNADEADIAQWKLTAGGSSMTYTMSPTDSFASGVDIDLNGTPLDAERTISDDTCKDFTLHVKPTSTAMRGRTIQPIITLFASEPDAIDSSVAPSFQVEEVAILGSGILRLAHSQLALAGGKISLELVKFPNSGLKTVDIQTNPIQFDPRKMKIEEVNPVDPYVIQTGSTSIDNRAGELRFSLRFKGAQLPNPQSPSREGTIASVHVTSTSQTEPGDRSQLIFQVDKVMDADGHDVTNQLVFSSGSVTWLQPGDIDLNGQTMVSDVLALAQALVADTPCGNLSDQQRRVADVAGTVSSGFPDHGYVTVNGNGIVTYTPAPDFVGVDHFTYKVTSQNGGSTTFTVDVVVQPGVNGQQQDHSVVQTTPGTPVEIDTGQQVSGQGPFVVDIGTPGDRAPLNKVPTCAPNEAEPKAAPEPDTDLQFERDGVTDLGSNDVRRIAELSLLSEATQPSSQGQPRHASNRLPGWLSWLGSLFNIPDSRAALDWRETDNSSQWRLTATDLSSPAGGIQGRILYDPDAVSIDNVRGVNGYQVIAVRADPDQGEARFVALAPQERRSSGSQAILQVQTLERQPGAALSIRIDQFVDNTGNHLPFKLVTHRTMMEALNVTTLEVRQTSQDQWRLQVHGQGVQATEIQAYDLGGRPRFQERSQGSQLEWRALDDRTGRSLANGIYLYVVTVEGVHGEVWRSDVRKLVVLR